MPDNSLKTLNCPACGAPLDFDESSSIVRCKFCHNATLLDSAQKSRRDESPEEFILLEPDDESPQELIFEEDSSVIDEIQEMLRAGNKIDAIHRYREVYDVSLAKAKSAVEEFESGLPVQPPVFIAAQTPAAKPVAALAGLWVGGLVILVTFLVVGGLLIFALSQPGSPFVPRMGAISPALLLPSGQGSLPDVAAVFYNGNTEARVIGLLDSASSELTWQTEALPGDGLVDAMAVGGDLIYVVTRANLMAFHRGDGSLAWQVTLPDRLLYGQKSLAVTPDQVLVLTLDRSLQAYDSVTGQILWSRVMAGYDRQIRVMAGQLVVIEYTGDESTYSLLFLDPADGSQQRVITPLCGQGYSADTVMTDSGLVYDESAHALYLIFGRYNGCVQRYDLRSGEMLWEAFNEAGFNSLGDIGSVQTVERLYFSDENRIYSIDKGAGIVQLLLEEQDYEFHPLSVSADVLVIRARRTRGSERFELWGLDAVTGGRLWQHDLGSSLPLDPPDEIVGLIDEDDSGWTWRQTPQGLLLLDFRAEPNRLVLTTLDPADGSNLGEMTVPFETISMDFFSAPDIIGWSGQVVYLILNTHVYVLDITSGELLLRYQ
ncbi:MAG: PQQ-binding-like beta-propeller repeat protein [Chloroflexota bacterium]